MRVRTGLALVTAVVLAAASAGRADDQAELKALVAKAIKATGGEEKLKKFEGMTLKGKGTAHADNMEVPLTLEGTGKGLGHFRLDMDATVNGMALKFLMVFQVDKGWMKAQEMVRDAPEEAVSAIRADGYALRLAQTLLPLQDAGCTLAPMGEIRVGDRPAVGVKASVKDRPEVNLYFDKETALLVRIDLQVKDMPGGQEVTHEFLFSEPKEFDGLKHPTKVVLNRDGKKLLDLELTEVKGDDKLDANLFEKP